MDEQDADARPGWYYVSVIDGPRKLLAAGPFATHVEALRLVRAVNDAACAIDPKAHWYAYGTARAERHEGNGVLNKQLNLIVDPTRPGRFVTRSTDAAG